MATIEELLQEQESTNLNLKLLKDSQDTNDKILMESMKSNELLESSSAAIEQLSIGVKDSFRLLGAAVKKLTLEREEELAPVINLPKPETEVLPAQVVELPSASAAEPLLLNPGPSDQALVPTPVSDNVVQPDSSVEVPAIPVETDESSDSASEGIEGVEKNTEEAIPLLARMASGIGSLVDDAKERALAALAVDRQTDRPDSASGSLDGLGGKLSSALGKAGVIGAVALATGALVKGVFDGITDDALIQDITGKARSDLTASEETFAILANSIEALSFGLFSAKEVFNFAQPAAETFQRGIDALFDPSTGVFKEFTVGVVKLIDGDLRGAFKEALSLLVQMPMKIFDLGQRIGTELIGLLPDSFTEGLQEMIDPILDPVFQFTTVTIPEAFSSAVDTITSGFDFMLELPGRIANTVSTFASDIVEGLQERVKSVTSSLPFGIGEKLSGLFSDADSQPEKADSQEIQRTASNSIAPLVSEAPVAGVEQLPTPQPVQTEGIFKAVTDSPQGQNIPQVAPATGVTAERTTQLSKERMDAQKVTVEAPPAQTIVVPEQKKEEKRITRKKESNDLTLAFMSQGSF